MKINKIKAGVHLLSQLRECDYEEFISGKCKIDFECPIAREYGTWYIQGRLDHLKDLDTLLKKLVEKNT